MADQTFKKSASAELENKYMDKGALEVAQDIKLTGYVGPGGSRKDRILRGEQVAMVQILYNKLIDEGKLDPKCKKIKVDGVYGNATAQAIIEMRAYVGTWYGESTNDEEYKRLKNKDIEYSMDGRTVELILRSLEAPKLIPKKLKNEEIDQLNRKIDKLESKLAKVSAKLDLFFQVEYMNIEKNKDAKNSATALGSANINLDSELKRVRESINSGDVEDAEQTLSEIEKEIDSLDAEADAWSAYAKFYGVNEKVTGTREVKWEVEYGKGYQSETKGEDIYSALIKNFKTKERTEMVEALEKGIKAEKEKAEPDQKVIQAFEAAKGAIEHSLRKPIAD